VATLKNKFARVTLTIRSGTDADQENISDAGATLYLTLCMHLVCGAHPVSWLRFSNLWLSSHMAWVRFVSFDVDQALLLLLFAPQHDSIVNYNNLKCGTAPSAI
jgi:hypothetical protein